MGVRLPQISLNQHLLESLMPIEFFSIIFGVINLLNFRVDVLFDWSQLFFKVREVVIVENVGVERLVHVEL